MFWLMFRNNILANISGFAVNAGDETSPILPIIMIMLLAVIVIVVIRFLQKR